jgi:hypothetical protein
MVIITCGSDHEVVVREMVGQTGVRTWDFLNLVRVRYRYATQLVSGGIINSNRSDTIAPAAHNYLSNLCVNIVPH